MKKIRLHRMTLWSLSLILLAAGTGTRADDDPLVKDIAVRLGGADAAIAASASEEAKLRVPLDPQRWVSDCRTYWIKPLLKAKRYDIIDAFSLQAVIAAPWQTGDVEFFQETRVDALLALDKPADALVQAKAFFNVTGLKNTEKALNLIVKCLRAMNKADGLVQLSREQLAGSLNRAPTEPPSKGGWLSTVVLDAAPYEPTLTRLTLEDTLSMQGKGNLLLLSGKPEEARAVFEKLVPRNDTAGLMAYYENIAKSIRAQDGNIGRANGYMAAVPDDHFFPQDETPGNF